MTCRLMLAWTILSLVAGTAETSSLHTYILWTTAIGADLDTGSDPGCCLERHFHYFQCMSELYRPSRGRNQDISTECKDVERKSRGVMSTNTKMALKKLHLDDYKKKKLPILVRPVPLHLVTGDPSPFKPEHVCDLESYVVRLCSDRWNFSAFVAYLPLGIYGT